MAKVLLKQYYSLLSIFLFAILFSEARLIISSHPFSTKLSAKAMAPKNEKLTHNHFYYHNLLAGPNVTALPLNPKGPLDFSDPADLFGRLTMVDNPLTLDPELNSTTVGSAQGLYGVASRSEVAFVQLFNFVFTADGGEYRGSTVTDSLCWDTTPYLPTGQGRCRSSAGTGVFGFARGKVHFKTYSFNTTTENAVVECDIYVFHY